MAGTYTDIPGRKFFYDSDGSVLFSIDEAGVASEITNQTTKNNINSESYASTIYGGGNGNLWLGVIFPELRSITHYMVANMVDWNGSVAQGPVQYSPDTITGTDGTWTTKEASFVGQFNGNNGSTGNALTVAQFRAIVGGNVTGIHALATPIASCKAFRIAINSSANRNKWFTNLHLYGDFVTTPSGLVLWHPTNDTPLTTANLDHGDTMRVAGSTKQFRVKNNHPTLTANNIVVSVDALTDTSPTVVSATTFDPGSGHVSAPNIGALAPGAISGVITKRVVPTVNHVLGPWRQRVKAIAGSWT